MMKKIFSMLLLSAAVVFASCSKDDPAPESVAVAFSALTANGSATETTTALTLTFDKVIEGLTAEGITLTAGETGAVKGALTAKGNGVYELAVSGIAKAGDVTVAVAKASYKITPASKTVAVKYVDPPVAVGNFYYSDKTYSKAYDNTKTCLGIVFVVNADGKSGKIVSLDEGEGSWGVTSYDESANGVAGIRDEDDGATATKNGNVVDGGWYLPAKSELLALYAAWNGGAGAANTSARSDFNAKLTTASGTAISTNYYWSSTEYGGYSAWSVDFSSGNTPNRVKEFIFDRVRAVLAF